MKMFASKLPIDSILARLEQTLIDFPSCVIVAAPGAGKTTRVPLALLDAPWLFGKKIITLEPRRLAARRSAEFMARSLGERCGETVGYRIRSESRTSSGTKIEVVTEGILTRMIQDDPELTNTAAVIFDEFHERSIHADLGLALAIDVQKNLRNDLRILVMSATMDAAAVAALLGNAPVLQSEGRLFPVETRYLRFAAADRAEQRLCDVIAESITQDEGDILVFLPGRREIRRMENLLFERIRRNDVSIVPLHGDLSSEEQDRALTPDVRGRKKIILSTSIAETSVTIDGVRVVVDGGRARTSRFDPRRGMSGLVTAAVSKATADQRRGRAGRQQSGICYRLWTEQEHEALPDYPQPEICSTDLAPFAMELASWGVTDTSSLAFLDPPPERHLLHAQTLLRSLNALNSSGLLTSHGKMMAGLPVHPRLAHMIISGNAAGHGGIACELAALMEEHDGPPPAGDIDAAALWHEYRRRGDSHTSRQIQRLTTIVGSPPAGNDDSTIGWLLALAYPERIAGKKDGGGSLYITVSGLTVRIPENSLLRREEFLVLAEVDAAAGGEARAYLAAPISREDILETFGSSLVAEEMLGWDPKNESVRAVRITRIGALQISERPMHADDEKFAAALCDGIRSIGLHALPWEKDSESFRSRSEWLRLQTFTGAEWPELSSEWLLGNLTSWLAPYLNGIKRRAHFEKIPLLKALKALFSYQQLQILDRLAPSSITVPSGSVIHIEYTPDSAPVLAVKLQEMFGLTESPRVADGRARILIHLLSPARRPLAVTQDLHSFWTGTYPDIRKQMRAEYPKHPWPEDPLTAMPTKKTNRALRNSG